MPPKLTPVIPVKLVPVIVTEVPGQPLAGVKEVIVVVKSIVLLGALGTLVPPILVAVTVKVYAVPGKSPVIVIELPLPVAVIPPGLAVTVYPVIAEPPLSDGGVKLIIALALLPATAVTLIGAAGIVNGVTDKLVSLGSLFPTAV